MNLSFYTAAEGAHQQQTRMDIHANNIANVNTYGFRARVPAFSSLLSGEVRAIDEDYQRGVGARVEDSELNLNQAPMTGTDRTLDFAIDGEGFFMLRDPASGETAYTRDGSFALMQYGPQSEDDPDSIHRWYLSDGNGRLVIGRSGQPVSVVITPQTDLTQVDFPVGVFDWINHNGMTGSSENRLQPVQKNGQVTYGSGKVVRGYLELSNADLATEMTKVIEAQRSYQMLLRMVTTSDEIETTTNSLR